MGTIGEQILGERKGINPCPICHAPGTFDLQMGKVNSVSCYNCGLEIIDGAATKEEVIARWNSLRSDYKYQEERGR